MSGYLQWFRRLYFIIIQITGHSVQIPFRAISQPDQSRVRLQITDVITEENQRRKRWVLNSKQEHNHAKIDKKIKKTEIRLNFVNESSIESE